MLRGNRVATLGCNSETLEEKNERMDLATVSYT